MKAIPSSCLAGLHQLPAEMEATVPKMERLKELRLLAARIIPLQRALTRELTRQMSREERTQRGHLQRCHY